MAGGAGAAALRRRWDGPAAAGLVRAVRTWLTGQGPRPAGLGTVEGRTDLRGIPLTTTPTTVGDPDDPARGVTWEGLDLSSARLEELRFFAGTVRDCRFDGASLVGLKLWGSEVVDCSFQRADLRSRGLGTGEWHGRRDVWRRVAFDRADLRESVFVGCVLDACTFERTSSLLQVVDAEVSGCTFVGELTSLLVSGQGHRFPVSPTAFSADLGRAVLRGSKIEGYALDRVRLPEQEDLLVVRRYPTVVRAATAHLRDAGATDAERRAGALLARWFAAPGSEDSDVCFDLGGFADAGLAEAVRRAVAWAEQQRDARR